MWTQIILIAFSVYFVANVFLYFAQERFLFRPEKLPEDFEFKYSTGSFTEHSIDIQPGVRINGIHFHLERPRGIILYLKGNSESIKGWGKFADDFRRLGFDVVMVDYRGFGKSTGKRSESGMKRDMQMVYDKIKEQVDEKNIIVYGRSLGSGFATKIASQNNPKMIILESPYYSLQKVTKRYLPFMPLSLILRFPLKTYKWIPYVKCPINIIHGTKDRLIPFNTAQALQKLKPESIRLFPVEGGGHNNLYTFEQYHRILREILRDKGNADGIGNLHI